MLTSSGLPDAFYAKLFSVDQSTVSRLRHSKIKKVSKYLAIVEANDSLQKMQDNGFAARLTELAKFSSQKPALRSILLNLHNLMQEFPEHRGGDAARD